MAVKISCQTFINNANLIHNHKYNYDICEYINSRTKVKILCKIHGIFLQTPNSHCRGRGCPKCAKTFKLSENLMIKRFNDKHNYFYDYSKSNINGNHKKIIIICPVHGEFKQAPQQHFSQGCPTCAGVKKMTTQEFIGKANKVHKNYYDYSKANYVQRSEKLKIICPKHGMFLQSVNAHLCGKGCIKCSTSVSRKESKWLDYLQVPNDSKHRNVLIHIGDFKFNIDGYYGDAKIIYEFLGDYWHGNPTIYNPLDINTSCKKSFGYLFKNTVYKIKILRSYGFKVVCMWEHKFDRKF